jgi:hypothetical protein
MNRPLKLNAREKTSGAGEKFEDFETHFRIKMSFKILQFFTSTMGFLLSVHFSSLCFSFNESFLAV